LSGDPSVLAAFKNETVVYRLGKDLDMDVSVNGLKAIGYGPDNILSMLSDIENALKNDLPVREFVGKLNNAKEHITSLVSEIGGKYNRLEDLISRYEDDWYNYKEIQASIEGIDEAEVITQLKLQEAVYRTALAVGAGAIQPSLLDFLK
jgi:flagellar hook-associated protein 3 FlgL